MSTSIQPNAPFRADIVGSFLRPQTVKDARAAYAAGTLDDDAGHARTLEILVHDLADGVIFEDEVTITLADLVGIGEPLGTMVLSDSQAVAKRIDLLTHL